MTVSAGPRRRQSPECKRGQGTKRIVKKQKEKRSQKMLKSLRIMAENLTEKLQF